jgi:hypothetical protein
MTERGTATIYPSETTLSSAVCIACKNRSHCFAGDGINTAVRGISHLFLPDYKNSWTLSVDLPDCKQLDKLLSLNKICADLYTGNRTHIAGRIIENHISELAELNVVEI